MSGQRMVETALLIVMAIVVVSMFLPTFHRIPDLPPLHRIPEGMRSAGAVHRTLELAELSIAAGRLPSGADQLPLLIGWYSTGSGSLWSDEWGTPIRLETHELGQDEYEVSATSAGPDRSFDTGDDLSITERIVRVERQLDGDEPIVVSIDVEVLEAENLHEADRVGLGYWWHVQIDSEQENLTRLVAIDGETGQPVPSGTCELAWRD